VADGLHRRRRPRRLRRHAPIGSRPPRPLADAHDVGGIRPIQGTEELPRTVQPHALVEDEEGTILVGDRTQVRRASRRGRLTRLRLPRLGRGWPAVFLTIAFPQLVEVDEGRPW